MLKRYFLFASLGGIFSLLLFGCSKYQPAPREQFSSPQDPYIIPETPGKYGGLFVVAATTEPKSFNFLINADAVSSVTRRRFLDGLVTLDYFSQKYVPQLAKSWEISEDKLSYVFKLRKCNWSDGTPFTADDVIFTFDAIFAKKRNSQTNEIEIDPKTGKPKYLYPNRYINQYTIGGKPLLYEKIDTNTVRFITAVPYAPFLNDIGFVPIIPKHKLHQYLLNGSLQKQWTTQTAIDSPEELVGTGPFKISSFVPGERIVFEPNPHYWKYDSAGNRLPYIDLFITEFVGESSAHTILFASGQTDASGVKPSDYSWIKKAEKTYDFTIHNLGPDTSISFLWFNQNKEKKEGKPVVKPYKLKWFRDKLFRQAVAHGINRPGIIKAVLFGHGTPLHSIISPGNKKWHNPKTRKYDYNPEKSRQLLKKAGFSWNEKNELFDSDDKRVEFELLSIEGNKGLSAIVTTIKENMKALGIEVIIIPIDFGTLIKRIDNTYNYEASIIRFTGGGDPSGGKSMYHSEGSNHLWYPEQKTPSTDWEKEIDHIIDKQEKEFDEIKRKALIDEMQVIFSEELPLIFLNNPTAFFGLKNKWQNVELTPLTPAIQNVEEIWQKN